MDLFEKEKRESVEFTTVFFRNIRLITWFVIASCIIALVVTLIIPKKYTSSATIFATETNSIDDVIRNPQFGYDVEADRLIQLLQTRAIMDSITKKFNLISYYHIDKTDADWYDQLTRKYNRDIDVIKTVFMSVIISAQTRDPEMSANIVNSIIALINSYREKILKQNLKFAFGSLKAEYNSLKGDLDSLSSIINDMTRDRKGLNQFLQTERYISLIFDKSILKDDQNAKSLQLVINQYNIKLGWLYDAQNKMKNAEMMIRRPLPSVYVIENAIPSYKKSSPKLSINLVIAFFSSLIVITFALYIIHKIKQFRLQMSS